MANQVLTKGVSAVAEEEDGLSDSEPLGVSGMRPYLLKLVIRGTADMFFHRYNDEDVEAKKNAKKGDAIKKKDNVEAYVWRDKDGEICLPGEYVRQSFINAAKSKLDPRSSRKSAKDLFKAAVISNTNLAKIIPAGMKKPTKDWDYLDTRRCVVNGSGIPRTRPVFAAGWTAELEFLVVAPSLVSPALLQEVANDAGLLVGVGDNRPSFGRFQVDKFEIIKK